PRDRAAGPRPAPAPLGLASSPEHPRRWGGGRIHRPRGGGAVFERGQPGGGYLRRPGPGAGMPARPPGATCGAAARSVVRKSLRPSEPQGRGGVRLSLNHKAAYRKLRPNAPRGALAFAETVKSKLSGRSPGRSAPSPAAGPPGGHSRTPDPPPRGEGNPTLLFSPRGEGGPAHRSAAKVLARGMRAAALGLVVQDRAQPAFGLGHRPALAAGVVLDLDPVELAAAERQAPGEAEIHARERGRRGHGQAV